MKHKTWFRLVIKAIGVLLIGLSLPHVVSILGQMAYIYVFEPRQSMNLLPGTFVTPPMRAAYWPAILGIAAQFGVGLYLLLGGRWLVDKVIPSNRPYCAECGYDLSKASGANCPECGVALLGAGGE